MGRKRRKAREPEKNIKKGRGGRKETLWERKRQGKEKRETR